MKNENTKELYYAEIVSVGSGSTERLNSKPRTQAECEKLLEAINIPAWKMGRIIKANGKAQ